MLEGLTSSLLSYLRKYKFSAFLPITSKKRICLTLGGMYVPVGQLVYLSTGFIDRGYARVCSSMHSTPELVPKALRAHKNQAATVPEVTDISSLCSFNTYHLASFCLLDNDKQHYLLTKCPRPCSIKCLHWHTLYHPTSYLPLPCLNPSYCHSWITFVC